MQSCGPGILPSGTYQVNTVRFVLSGPRSDSGGPAPGIWIDTKTKLSGLAGGTLKSGKPYGLGIDYTDSTFTFAAAEFTGVEIAYDDGTVDPGTKALDLPLRIAGREYETINSVAVGKVVNTKVRVISGKIPGIINRDEPFTLRLKGLFIKDDGSKIPFTIDQHYDIEKQSGTKTAAEVMQDA
jgi:hypothetical protein